MNPPSNENTAELVKARLRPFTVLGDLKRGDICLAGEDSNRIRRDLLLALIRLMSPTAVREQ